MITTAERFVSFDPGFISGASSDVFWSHFAHSLQTSITRPIHRAEYSLRKIRGLESRHSVWNAKQVMADFIDVQKYVAETGAPREMVREITESLLARNWETFLDEVVGWKTPEYDYTHFGLPHGYMRSMNGMGYKFVEALHQKGGNTLRAEVEGNNMQRLTHWMSQSHPLGTQLFWLSVRGSKADGYPGEGLENPNMINIYTQGEVTEENPTGVTYQQYKSWLAPDDIPAFHSEVLKSGYLLGGQFHTTTDLPGDLAIIDQLIELPPDHGMDWEALIYQDEAKWETKREDYPIFGLEAFETFRNQVFTEYFNHIFSHLYSAWFEFQHQGDQYWNSREYRHALKALDTYFLSCAESVFKWTDDFDQRSVKTERQDYIAKFKKKLKISTKEPLTEETNLQLLSERLDLQTRVLRGDALTAAERQRLNKLGQLYRVSNRALSLGQCGALSPFSLAMKAGRLESMPLPTRKERLAYLGTYVRLDLPGAKEVYMVPPSYLEAPGCRVVTEGPNKGEVEGPCGLLLSNPEDDAMTEAEWLTEKHKVAQSIQESELADIVLSEAATPEEAQRFESLVDRLTTRLFNNSLDYLISGIPELSYEAYQLPPEMFRLLRESNHRLDTLEEIVTTLESGESELFNHALHVTENNTKTTQDLLEAIAA